MIGMSVCSGIGAPEYSAPFIDWRYQSEVEKFPSAVLTARFPDATNLGDMTKFKEWPDANVDVLCGGTPCQAFSIAGLRKGLDDPRGNLMLTYLACAARYSPRWLVWENVPGVLSSNGGRDFAALIGGLERIGYHAAWRMLDVQYGRTFRFPFAIPQRRRRLFLVGYLGDWRRPAAVLFDRESLSRNSPPRRQAGQAVAPPISARTNGGGGLGTDFDLDGGLQLVAGCMPHQDHGGVDTQSALSGYLIPVATISGGGSTHALTCEGHDASEDGSGRGTPIIAFGSKDHGADAMEGVSPNISAGGHDGSHQNAGVPPAIAFNSHEDPEVTGDRTGLRAVAFAQNQRGELRTSDVALQLTTGGGKPGEGYPAVAFDMRGREGGAQMEGPHDTANLRPASGGSSRSYVAHPWAVRRLTPVECERLMGFPDGWTQIPWRGKPAELCPDGPRYKALGNSWGVNCGENIFDRIRLIEGLTNA